jgi:hypothetical protein
MIHNLALFGITIGFSLRVRCFRSAKSIPSLYILIQLVPSGLLDDGLIEYLVVGIHPDCLQGIKCLLDAFNERVTHHVEAQVDCLNGYLMLVLMAAT